MVFSTGESVHAEEPCKSGWSTEPLRGSWHRLPQALPSHAGPLGLRPRARLVISVVTWVSVSDRPAGGEPRGAAALRQLCLLLPTPAGRAALPLSAPCPHLQKHPEEPLSLWALCPQLQNCPEQPLPHAPGSGRGSRVAPAQTCCALSLRGSDLFFGKAEILKKLTFCLGQFKTGLQQPWGSQQRGRGDAAPVAGWERAPAARRVHAALGLLWDRGCKKLQSGHEGSRVNVKLSIPHWEVICSQKDASAFKKKIY